MLHNLDVPDLVSPVSLTVSRHSVDPDTEPLDSPTTLAFVSDIVSNGFWVSMDSSMRPSVYAADMRATWPTDSVVLEGKIAITAVR